MFGSFRRFHAKHSKWCSTDKNNKAGIVLENITSTVSSSCIYLIFASNSTYLTTGIEQSIYHKCHHNIIYGKLNFDIPLPPPYYRKIWDYKKANTEAIKRDISVFLSLTLLNIFNNFISNKISKFSYKKPVWMNKEITLLLKKRSKLTKKYYYDPTDHNKNLMVNAANECTRRTIAAKEKNLIRLSTKLEDPSAAPKTCWSILNRF